MQGRANLYLFTSCLQTFKGCQPVTHPLQCLQVMLAWQLRWAGATTCAKLNVALWHDSFGWRWSDWGM